MAQVNHRQVMKLAFKERGNITDRQYFTSPIFSGYLADIAAAQTGLYSYNRRVHVDVRWKPKEKDMAYIDQMNVIHINAGNAWVAKQKTRADRFHVVLGLFCHELGHSMHSDFLKVQSYNTRMMTGNWYPYKPKPASSTERHNMLEIADYCTQSPKHGKVVADIASYINNILEDSFIEEKMLTRYPGMLGECLAIMRGVQFEEMKTVADLIDLEEDEDSGVTSFSTITSMLLSYGKWGLIKYGGTPKTDFRVQLVYDLIDELDNAITSADARTRFATSNIIMIRLWEYIKPIVDAAVARAEQQEAEGSLDEEDVLDKIMSGVSGTSTIGSGTTVPAAASGDGDTPSPESSPSAQNRAQTAKEAKGEDKEKESSPASGTMTTPETAQRVKVGEDVRIGYHETSKIETPVRGSMSRDDSFAGSQYEQRAADIDRLLDKIAQEKVTSRLEKQRAEELNELANSISYGNAHEGVQMSIHRIPSVDPQLIADYNEVAAPLLAISERLQKSLKDKIKDKRHGGKLTGLTFGPRLDTKTLYRKDGRHFYRQTLPNDAPELVVGLLLDESGSMARYDRATYARASAIILYDFCKSLYIPVMVYGHSTSHGVDLYSYAEFDAIDNSDPYRLMDISARGSNRDGAALRYVAEQLSRRREDIKLLILVSDGQPADGGYYGTAAEEDLRGIKAEYERKGVHFIAAAIGTDKENIERIYANSFLDITDLSTLPQSLTAKVKQFINL